MAPSLHVLRFVLTSIDSELHGIVAYKEQDDKVKIALVHLSTGKVARSYDIPFIKELDPRIRLSEGGAKFFVAVQKSTLFIVDKHSSSFIAHNNVFQINVVACHPEEDLVATGDCKGRIVLWRNIFDKNPVKAELHWHHMIVLSLAFSQSGTILYSGGVECVLVKWQINEKAITKDFLPRLSGSVKQISVDSNRDKITLSTDDNAIHLISSNLKVIRSIQDFTRVSPYDLGLSVPFPAGIQINPRNQHLVLNGRIGHLQFFSTRTMKLLFNVDISMRNVVPRQKKQNIFSTEVTHTAFSMSWMATVETWNDKVNSPDSRLKFWKFDANAQTYALHTQIEQAHAKEIISLEFSSQQETNELICASAGRDRCIKIWSLEKSENVKNAKLIWLCIEQLSYKNLPVTRIAFSQDSSLIAAGFGNVLCVWDSMSFKLKCALSSQASNDGSANRVMITLPPKPVKKSSHVENTLEKRRQIVDLMRSMISEKCDESLVKKMSQEKKSRYFTQKSVDTVKAKSLSKAEKETIFKRVLAIQDLSFNQKIQILHKLHIYYNISSRVEQELVDYMRHRTFECQQLYKNLNRKVGQIKSHEKYKLQWRFRTFNLLSSKRNRKAVTVRKLLTQKIDEKLLDIQKEKEHTENLRHLLPIKNLTHVSNVVFCTEELSHLAIVTTLDRVLIWDLLSLKLQGSFKVHTKFITLDPRTNLVAVFTKYNELFVFHPNPALTIHHQKKMPEVFGAIWVPRENPRSQSINVNWQAASQLLFLNEQQEVCAIQLPGEEDYANTAPFMEITNNFNHNTPFAAMIAQTITDETTKDSRGMTKRITVSGSGAVKDVSNPFKHLL